MAFIGSIIMYAEQKQYPCHVTMATRVGVTTEADVDHVMMFRIIVLMKCHVALFGKYRLTVTEKCHFAMVRKYQVAKLIRYPITVIVNRPFRGME